MSDSSAWCTGKSVFVLFAGGSTPFALMDASLPILHQKNCIDLLGSAVTPNMLCAGFPEGGIDSCQVRTYKYVKKNHLYGTATRMLKYLLNI